MLYIIWHGKSERIAEFPIGLWNENAKVLKALLKGLNINKINILGPSGGTVIK